MFRLKNIRIGVKIGGGFSIVTVMLALLAVVGIVSLAGVVGINKQVAGVLDMSKRMVDARQNEKNYIIRGERSYADTVLAVTSSVVTDSSVLITELKNESDRKNALAFKAAAESYQAAFNKYLEQGTEQAAAYSAWTGKAVQMNNLVSSGALSLDGEAKAFFTDRIQSPFLLLRIAYMYFLLEKSDQRWTEARQQLAVLEKGIIDTAGNAQRLGFEEAAIASMKTMLAEYNGLGEKYYQTVVEQRKLDGLMVESARNAQASAQVLLEGLDRRMEETVSGAETLLIAVSIIAVLFSILISVFITKGITGPVSKGIRFAKEMSEGDLRVSLDVRQKDEIGMLADALREMRDRLSEIVQIVSSGSAQIASASEQLASGNQDLSNRTEQQASALEETSSAIEEMNASIKSNADNTVNADQLSREAVTKTEEGSRTVGEMVTSMDEINVSSNRIADIIEVITNIAFQTNLLALNASIEAARAGEQGKGFAVVAVEVRKLAKRSDRAAKEITDIIKNSNRKVTEGVEIANRAGEVLQEINAAVRKVTTLVGEISAASQEQLSSADQIDKTLSSLDENTQKNAALVEEAASATEELSAQAQELNAAMQFFRLAGASGMNDPEEVVRIGRESGNTAEGVSPELSRAV